MTKENGVKVLTDMVADFVAHIGKKLPDDVVKKLEELGSQETAALPKVLYETMTKNQGLAVELNRPSCQDTGVLQFWVKCGTKDIIPLRLLMSTIQRKTLVKELRLYGGILLRTAINVRSTHTWQAADVLFLEKQWF